MKFNFIKKCALTAIAAVSITNASAQWTQVKDLPASYAAFKTESGNLLLSDYQFDYSGGINISTDNGATWTKTAAEDHCYNRFVRDGKYIYAIGLNACIARSEDEGQTWKILSYAKAAEPVMDEGAVDFTACYGMCVYKGKLFIADFCGGGVMFSEDNGETWQRTEIKTMQYDYTDEYGQTYTLADNLYQIFEFNGKLYTCGMYNVYEYVDDKNDWIIKRYDSNFMAEHAIFNGALYVGRSCPNDDPAAPFLEMTTDFENWTYIPSPEGIVSKNVRTMSSDDHYVYICMQDRGAFVYDVAKQTWYEINDGYPELQGGPSGEKFYCAPTKTFADDEYLYNVIYVPAMEEGTVSGLYKYPVKAIHEVTAIDNVTANDNITVSGRYLSLPAGISATVTIYDAAGRQVLSTVASGSLYLGNLTSGIYAFQINNGTNTVKGKFAI